MLILNGIFNYLRNIAVFASKIINYHTVADATKHTYVVRQMYAVHTLLYYYSTLRLPLTMVTNRTISIQS